MKRIDSTMLKSGKTFQAPQEGEKIPRVAVAGGF
jgi:hypothetical protein